MSTRYPSLTLDEARARVALVSVTGYDIDLDLSTGDQRFGSVTRVRFSAAEAGGTTFIDLKAVELHEARLNGVPLPPEAFADGRLTLTDLYADNELVVRATMAYGRDGSGLHRAVDPADGAPYLFIQSFLDAAPRVYACFDQPDLKAPYDVRVTAPEDWTVLGNGAATQDAPGRWTLATTKPLSTYFMTVCAGPFASVHAEHDGIRLGVHVRRSLADQLAVQAPEILTVTRACLDYYHDLFGIRYPFGDYHQVFVPEFNAGAMENPGCVTFRDQMIFRGAATDQERLSRANTIAHEMAHMWFGDLVTMTWWDDLWLNESFAEYMAYRTTSAATEFTAAWTDFTMARKAWGYAAERSPSTHPVAGNPPADAISALANFDGISYAKGAAVLQQLVAYLGDEAFIAGLRDYLTRFAYANAALGDFLAAMERASGRDLSDWSAAWLRTASLDVISVKISSDGARITSAEALRTVPADHPADRPHALDIKGYDGGRVLVSTSLVLDDDAVELPQLVGAQAPHLVVPNASSLSWATVRLSPRSLQAVTRELPLVPDEVARAVVWSALYDGVVDAVIDPRLLIDVIEAAWPVETNPSILGSVNNSLMGRVVTRYLPASERSAARDRCVAAALRLREAHDVGSSAYLLALRRLALWSGDLAWVRAVAEGDAGAAGLPPFLASDMDLRWIAVRNLAQRGQVDAAYIAAAERADHSLSGHLAALACRSALPDPESKAWAWDQITGAHDRSNYELNELAGAFWDPDRADELAPYVPRAMTELPALAGRLGDDALSYLATVAFPGVLVDESTAQTVRATLEGADLTVAVRRAFVDGLAALEHALASRRRYGG